MRGGGGMPMHGRRGGMHPHGGYPPPLMQQYLANPWDHGPSVHHGMMMMQPPHQHHLPHLHHPQPPPEHGRHAHPQLPGPTGTRVVSVCVRNVRREVDCRWLQGALEGELRRRQRPDLVYRVQLWQGAHATVHGLVELSTPEAASVLVQVLNGGDLRDEHGNLTGMQLSVAHSDKQAVQLQDLRHGHDFVTRQGQGHCPVVPTARGHSVVMVSNLVIGITPDMIQRLFGTCGDVVAVKIVFKQRSQALVQYKEARQAEDAVELLHHCPFGYEEGRSLNVALSVHPEISGQPDELTQYWPHDWPMHRFTGRNAGRNMQQRFGPQSQLLLSNIPKEFHGSSLNEMLARCGCHDIAVKWLPITEQQRMALAQVRLPCVRQAVMALIALHGFGMPGHAAPPRGKGLVCSFSRPDCSTQKVRGQGMLIPPPNGLVLTDKRPPSATQAEAPGRQTPERQAEGS
eukprot:TRINITY_DN5735_c0_g1_i1.p1 TRINITY_DN5735_c0_g1~~TRINITY_DN5735_c0_g1_i1.p1  ORF type:complete len:457 (+),score=130.60 TRINITY_DN5735_c0_g1_i1:75-1445(+)